MKLYLLHYFNTNNKLPIIDKIFVNSCIKTVCIKNETRGRPPTTTDLKNDLTNFYNLHFRSLISTTDQDLEKLTYTNMNQILEYMSEEILTMYENNIKQHYVEYIERYVNVIWNKEEKKAIINSSTTLSSKEKEKQIRDLCGELRTVKTDILDICEDKLKSKPCYHRWINEQLSLIIPEKDIFDENLYYDLQCHPFDYLPCMIRMMKTIEKPKLFIYNVFPMRTEIIPKHIRIDTKSVVELLIRKEHGTQESYLQHGALKERQDQIWNLFFKINRKCFHKPGYKFHHMIETDGVSCTISLIREDLVGKFKPKQPKKVPELYLDQAPNLEQFKKRKIIGFDPGKDDLVYGTDGDTREATTFRYSQDQRRKESRTKRFSKIILEFKKQVILGKTVIEHETELSQYNRKTLNIAVYSEYIRKKVEINKILSDFYKKYIFRKLKLNGYINRQKSEQKMINNIRKIFGEPQEVVLCIGDWCQRKHSKFKEPTIGIGMRKVFRRNGYDIYLIDEDYTSSRCLECKGGQCEKFLTRESPRPYRKGNFNLVHGLLKCKTCKTMWNRDCLGSKNIYRLAYNIINGLGRPEYLCYRRETNQLGGEVVAAISPVQ